MAYDQIIDPEGFRQMMEPYISGPNSGISADLATVITFVALLLIARLVALYLYPGGTKDDPDKESW